MSDGLIEGLHDASDDDAGSEQEGLGNSGESQVGEQFVKV